MELTSVAKAFDKVSLLSHLVKGEGDQASTSMPPRAGRPTPVFSDVKNKDEELSGTIPWAVPVTPSRDGGIDGSEKASHHNHHHHLPPAPAAHHHGHLPPCLVSLPPR